jgi:hypothetical protein
MEAAILILALFFVAFVALGAYAGAKAIGAAARGVDRTITQARRTVEDTTLRARSLGQLGLPGELAQLRLRLRTSMRATQDALQVGAAEDASLAESIGLFQRLTVHGRELDSELKQLERDPDRARVTARLPELRERTEQITRSSDSLRWAARDRARKFAEDDLSSLSAQIDVESGALRHWSPAERTADGGPPPAQNAAWPEQNTAWPEPEPEPEAERPDRTVADEVWPGPPPVAEPQPIEPPDLRKRTVYPWQRSARPTRPGTTN